MGCASSFAVENIVVKFVPLLAIVQGCFGVGKGEGHLVQCRGHFGTCRDEIPFAQNDLASVNSKSWNNSAA